ncbi:hypothetical protein [Pontibacter amylolyticus]|uniref:hypothetical protein n=1 Tax=Pontibacter amylolyticus TaxID=1424080 RepID=UPI001669774A|nr:hypothetical protein [Pontibacter amylolyticus]
MMRYSFLDPALLKKAFFDPMRPDEICWKPRDIEAGIRALTTHGKSIGAISIYFKSGDGVYCPVWGDCLLLEGVNDAYWQLFEGLHFQQEVTLELVYQLINRFALVKPQSYDWAEDAACFKTAIASELTRYNLSEMYFCLQLD